MNKRFREPVSGLIHLVSAGLAVVGAGAAADRQPGRSAQTALGGDLRVQPGAVIQRQRHLSPGAGGRDATRRLRKFDHAAIYVLIAGTYTPICVNFFSGWLQWGFLALIWAMALAGVVVKLFVINAPRWVTAGIYLVMGWMAVLVIKPMLAAMPVGGLIVDAGGRGAVHPRGGDLHHQKAGLLPGGIRFPRGVACVCDAGGACHFIMVYGTWRWVCNLLKSLTTNTEYTNGKIKEPCRGDYHPVQ